MESLEMLANNLANASTGGYKSDREFYSLYVSPDAVASEGDGVTGSPDRLPVVESQYTDYSQGVIRNTGNPLDFAISGRGFFAVNGPTGPLYTRNGSFRLSSSGTLITSDGLEVRSKGGKTIQSRSTSPIEAGLDGVINQDGQPIGQFETVSFDEPSQLNKQGMNYFYKIDPAVTPSVSSAEIHQGKLESSNVGSAEAAVRLISVMRQFEMLSKAVTIGADMDKQALQEVARVSS